MIASRSAFSTGARMAVKANGAKATMSSRPLWLPGSTAPAHLTGTLPGECPRHRDPPCPRPGAPRARIRGRVEAVISADSAPRASIVGPPAFRRVVCDGVRSLRPRARRGRRAESCPADLCRQQGGTPRRGSPGLAAPPVRHLRARLASRAQVTTASTPWASVPTPPSCRGSRRPSSSTAAGPWPALRASWAR